MTLNPIVFGLDMELEQTKQNIARWLREDLGSGDMTSMSTIPLAHQSKGIIHVKDQGIIAGMPLMVEVFRQVDPQLHVLCHVEDGAEAVFGTVLAEIGGSTHSILKGERLALNLLQRLSGIATRTREYCEAVQGLDVRVVDTRKTTPGHRALEKYAVRVGGEHNHRFGLYDAVLIKDNHIKAAGGVLRAVNSARAAIPHTMKIQVEVENMDQLREAIEVSADIIMLDNMSLEQMERAVLDIKAKHPHVIVEASGGVTLQTIRRIAQTGVDVISVGALTYSFKALDISLDLNSPKEAAGNRTGGGGASDR